MLINDNNMILVFIDILNNILKNNLVNVILSTNNIIYILFFYTSGTLRDILLSRDITVFNTNIQSIHNAN